MAAPEGNKNAVGNKGGGRKTAYNPEYANIAKRLALLGATDKDFAVAFDVCETTITAWKTKYIEFSEDTYWDIKEQILIHNKTLYNYNELEYMKRINELEYEIEYDKSITDINDMLEWSKGLKFSRCGLGHTAGNPIVTSIKNFRHLYEKLVQRDRDFDSGFNLAESVRESCEAAGRDISV